MAPAATAAAPAGPAQPAAGRARTLVAELGALAVDTVRRVIGAPARTALLDFEDSWNCGEAVMWAGKKAVLKALGVAPVYECTMKSYDSAALAAAVGDGTILLRGGGNFGDLYIYHGFHKSIVEAFPDNRIVVFPQTVRFNRPENLEASRAVFDRHPNLTVLARDLRSYRTLRRYFPSVATLPCPDMGFVLGAMERPVEPQADIVWIARTDKESAFAGGTALAGTLGPTETKALDIRCEALDGEQVALAVDVGGGVEVTDWYRLRFARREGVAAFTALDYEARATLIVRIALAVLARGRVVVTDRLHGHILCVLMGVPHVVLDNNYGKLRDFYHCWTYDCGLARWAETPDEALAIARSLL